MSDRFGAFRPYASAPAQKKIGIWVTALGGLAVALSFFHLPEASLPFGAAAATLLIISGLITTPVEECSFCRKPRVAVRFMVAGPSTTICDECAALSMETFARQYDQTRDAAWISFAAFTLPDRCPRAISTPLFRACVIKDENHRQQLLTKASEVRNPVAVEELLRRTPDAEREARDWINLGVALERQGKFREALEAIEQVAGLPEHEPWLLNNRGSARLQLEPCDDPTLRRLLADNLRARELLEKARPSGYERTAAVMLGQGAELHRRLREYDAALECLTSARAVGGDDDPARLITQAEIMAAQGDKAEARTLLDRALELAHPESREVCEARQLIETLRAP